MNTYTAELITKIDLDKPPILYRMAPKKVMKRLLNMGYKTLLIKGALFEQFDGGIFLFVDDDILSLIMDYLSLEKLIENSKKYQHGTYLNDGLFGLNAKSDRKIVKLEFQYCPGLDIKNLVRHTQTLTEEEYVGWWRSIAYEILNLASF